jgi:protoheme IX farnesyltransferase
MELALFTTSLAAFLATVTLVTYLFLYTPLKRITPWATAVGGIPGALPPLIGWAAVTGEVSAGAWILFAVLFFWQMPHFFSLAWMYRQDYSRAGYRLLTVLDLSGDRTAKQILVYSVLLLIVFLVCAVIGYSGVLSAGAAILASLCFLGFAVQFWISRTNEAARQLFIASLIYLPVLLLFMVVDRL